jgi:hypothetical protein
MYEKKEVSKYADPNIKFIPYKSDMTHFMTFFFPSSNTIIILKVIIMPYSHILIRLRTQPTKTCSFFFTF